MNLQNLAKEYFDTMKLMQLATVNNGQPWICSVYFVTDDNFNLYWMSARERQHSQEILSNPNVAVTVVKDAERKQALQIIGQVHEATDEELRTVHELYTAKFGPNDSDLDEIKKHLPQGRAYWVCKPTEISFWDEVNFPDAPKQQVPLPQ